MKRFEEIDEEEEEEDALDISTSSSSSSSSSFLSSSSSSSSCFSFPSLSFYSTITTSGSSSITTTTTTTDDKAMDPWLILRQTFSLIFIAVSCSLSGQSSGAECPQAYWDEPSKRCSDSLHAVLDEIRTSDRLISTELRLNKTCKEWERTNLCYQQLIQRCHSDAHALHEIRIHIARYSIYSLPCQDPSLRYRKNMADCFLPDIKSTRTCTEAIDKYLRKFVDNEEYRSACRVVSTAMKCFHDIKNNIRHRCRQEGANEYHHSYIQPLVDQTRDTVLTQCSLSSPYKEYFLNGAISRHSHRSYSLAIFLALAAATCAFFLLQAPCLFRVPDIFQVRGVFELPGGLLQVSNRVRVSSLCRVCSLLRIQGLFEGPEQFDVPGLLVVLNMFRVSHLLQFPGMFPFRCRSGWGMVFFFGSRLTPSQRQSSSQRR